MAGNNLGFVGRGVAKGNRKLQSAPKAPAHAPKQTTDHGGRDRVAQVPGQHKSLNPKNAKPSVGR